MKLPPLEFRRAVEQQAFALLEARGLFLRVRNPKFVEHWVKVGKSPEEIVTIALGRPDNTPEATA